MSDRNKMVAVSIRLPDELRKKLILVALVRKVSMAAVVRQIMQEYLEARPPTDGRSKG